MKNTRLALYLVLSMVLAVAPAFAADNDGIPTPTDSKYPANGRVSRPDVPGSLTTLFAGGNGFAGNTFDLNPVIDLLWTGTDFHLATGSATTMEIYTRAGTAQGNENSPTGWTSIGTEVVTPAGTGSPTASSIGNGQILTAGATIGTYVDTVSYPSATLQYTNGGPTTFSNADLSLTTYVGKGNPAFTGSTFTPRQWNGTIHYDDQVPVELMGFEVE